MTSMAGVVANLLISETDLFDFTTQSWSFGPQLISPIASYNVRIRTVALSRTRVFILLGCTVSWDVTSQTYIYDFTSNSWTATANMNTARCIVGAGLVQTSGESVAKLIKGIVKSHHAT